MRRFLPFAALGGLFFLFLTLTSGGPPARWAEEAWAQVTTYKPPSQLATVTTFNPGTTLLPLSINTGGGWISRGAYIPNVFGGISTTGHTHSAYLTSVNLSPYLTTYTDTTGGGITTTQLAAYQYVTTSQLAARGYLTTYTDTTGSGLTTTDLAAYQYVSTTDLAARGYITWAGVSTTGHVHAQYLTTFVVPSEYITSSALNARGYLTTYTDTIGTGSFSAATPYTWTANQQFVADPSTLTSGQWLGRAVMGTFRNTVTTYAVVYRVAGMWETYSAIQTGGIPQGMVLTNISTLTPGQIITDGFANLPGLNLGTTTVTWFAGTGGAVVATPPGGAGLTVVAILENWWNGLVRFIFGLSWGTR